MVSPTMVSTLLLLFLMMIGTSRAFQASQNRSLLSHPSEKTRPLQAQKEDIWDVGLYQKHSFVYEYGTSLVDILNPQPGERILDVGCGSGQLTNQIAQAGAIAMGLDASAAMIQHCQQTFPELDFVHTSVTDLTLKQHIQGHEPVDAIFSNAALHWVLEAEEAVEAMVQVLKPGGGRFVVELGGHGNIAAIVQASLAVTGKSSDSVSNLWYFPKLSEYTTLLESHGMEVSWATLFDRPSTLQDGERGMYNWLTMFGEPLLKDVPESDRKEVKERIVAKLKEESNLFDGTEWHADYRRLRVVARKL